MIHIDLTDTPNQHAYLKRLLMREQARLRDWVQRPGYLNEESRARIQEDLASAESILEQLQ